MTWGNLYKQLEEICDDIWATTDDNEPIDPNDPIFVRLKKLVEENERLAAKLEEVR